MLVKFNTCLLYFLFYTSAIQSNKMTDDTYAYTYNNAFSPDIGIDTYTRRTKTAPVLLLTLVLCVPSLPCASACVGCVFTTVMLMLLLTSKYKQA